MVEICANPTITWKVKRGGALFYVSHKDASHLKQDPPFVHGTKIPMKRIGDGTLGTVLSLEAQKWGTYTRTMGSILSP
jgi:hypothetical protein